MKNGLDLGGAYEAMLGRIKAQDGEKSRLGMAVLMWISHSRQPLQVNELCHAIAIQIGSNDLNSDDIPAISTLLDCCQGLVTVDKGASNVRLIHFTLQEHLCAHPDIFDRAHSTMAEICLTYLNSQRIKDLPADTSPDSQCTPFLKYSSLYWGTHMRMEISDLAKALALELLDQFDSHISAEILWDSIFWRLSIEYLTSSEPFSALHCVSYFGIADVTNTLVKMNRWDVNQKDAAGMTPLIWAARYGHEEVVRLLLQNKHIQPDQQDADSWRTALSWAAGYGHEGVVRLFLGPQFVNPGSLGRPWGKAQQVAGLLFGKRYVNPDSSSISGRTPLSWAAEEGHEGIVKLLLERKDVNPNIPDTWRGQTPLSHAAANGHEGTVKLLLGRKDVNPDIPDTWDGRTPLSKAAGNSHEGVVKLLSGRGDVNPNSLSKSGRTPLLWAVKNGHEGTVKLLLEWEDVNPNTPDAEYGRTPLSWAAENSHERLVKLLLGRRDANPNSLSKSGRTPLLWAAGNGHEGTVKLLLERKDVNPDIPDTWHGRTPLSHAARNGHEGVVKLLLGRKDVNPNASCKSGRTPLSLAAEEGREGVVKLLLGQGDVNPNDIPDTLFGQTPLSRAAGNGHGGIVKLLLEREDVNPDIPDTWCGQTPLSWAARYGREGIVKLLLGRKHVNPNSSDKSGKTPLMLAAEGGHERVVELLWARHSQHIQ